MIYVLQTADAKEIAATIVDVTEITDQVCLLASGLLSFFFSATVAVEIAGEWVVIMTDATAVSGSSYSYSSAAVTHSVLITDVDATDTNLLIDKGALVRFTDGGSCVLFALPQSYICMKLLTWSLYGKESASSSHPF